MIILHVKIIAFQTIINHSFSIFYIGRKDCSLYNKQKNTWVLGNTRFISRVEHVSRSFATLTLEISCSTLEIYSVFPRTMYYSLYNAETTLKKQIRVENYCFANPKPNICNSMLVWFQKWEPKSYLIYPYKSTYETTLFLDAKRLFFCVVLRPVRRVRPLREPISSNPGCQRDCGVWQDDITSKMVRQILQLIRNLIIRLTLLVSAVQFKNRIFQCLNDV